MQKIKRRIYLDHAATTYLDDKVVKAMAPYWTKEFGNPSSLYSDGANAKKAIESARARIAKVLNAKSSEIIFTAGGTESVNLAIFGVVRNHLAHNKNKPHIICSAIEHHAVLESFAALKGEGVEVTIVPVGQDGLVKAFDIAKAIRRNTVLVSVMYANNEIGTIQPIAEISKTIKKINPKILFHSDACQAAGALPLDVNKLGVDLLTINGSKIYGPKQIGLLYIRQGLQLKPIIYGGGQENSLRSGTENVPAIIGFAEALEIAEKNIQKENKRLTVLRDYFIKQAFKTIPNLVLNGDAIKRLANNINFSVLDAEGEALMLYLDAKGIEISTGSACTSTSMDASHVITAIGRSETDAKSAIRISLGRQTTKQDLDFTLKTMIPIIKQLRTVSQL
ncbi:MAG: aminotransferase, class superfamily [Candidatus Doudnabacteria bacterium]|nr:aminotransferase, class superfamily [Candidatus Doudnabacteria bacterium]